MPDGSIGTRLIGDQNFDESTHHTTVEHVKRADKYPQSKFIFGDEKLYWGCDVDPIKELDHISDMCVTEQCDQKKTYTRDIKYLDLSKGGNPGAPDKKTLTISANGFFKTGLRNALVASIQKAAGAKNLIKWTRGQEWAEAGNAGPHGSSGKTLRGKCDIAQFTNVIGINVWAGEDNIVASIQAQISIASENNLSGFCKAVDVGSSVAGAFGPVGAGAAAFLGVVKATCS